MLYSVVVLFDPQRAGSIRLHSSRKTAPLRVMTYNIHRWAGEDGRLDVGRLAQVIQMARSDVVGLNEVLHPVMIGSRNYEPLRELADRLGMVFAFGPSGWIDRNGPGWRGPAGNALLSRYPLAGVVNTPLPGLPGAKQRSMLGATLSSGPMAGLSAFVTHLDHVFEGTRLLQIRAALDRLAHHGPHFLCGDFNTPGFQGPHSRRFLPPVLRSMRRAGYLDAFDAIGKGAGHTFPARSPLFRIDFLFFPMRWARGLHLAQTLDGAVTRRASDHRPVVAEWSWPETASA